MVDNPHLFRAVRMFDEAIARTPYVPHEITQAWHAFRGILTGESGPDLAALRETAGLTQAQLARSWITPDHPQGITKAYVGRVERQDVPSPETRAAYLAALEKARNV